MVRRKLALKYASWKRGNCSLVSGWASAALLAVVEHGGHTYHVYNGALTWQQVSDFSRGETVGGRSSTWRELMMPQRTPQYTAACSPLMPLPRSFRRASGVSISGRGREIACS